MRLSSSSRIRLTPRCPAKPEMPSSRLEAAESDRSRTLGKVQTTFPAGVKAGETPKVAVVASLVAVVLVAVAQRNAEVASVQASRGGKRNTSETKTFWTISDSVAFFHRS